jgi:hypothetical protein
MSFWGDVHKRSRGDEIRKEEFARIYFDCNSPKREVIIADEGDYEGYHYTVSTAGDYPVVCIETESKISFFSGADIARLKLDDKEYDLYRHQMNGTTRFCYDFNKEGDYVHNQADGHVYTVNEVVDYAKQFIDKIINCDHDFDKYL